MNDANLQYHLLKRTGLGVGRILRGGAGSGFGRAGLVQTAYVPFWFMRVFGGGAPIWRSTRFPNELTHTKRKASSWDDGVMRYFCSTVPCLSFKERILNEK